jgi:hypothetical protein
MSRTLDETRTLLATCRQTPRPTYFSPVSNANTTISYEFETYLILLENTTKQALLSRLRKAKKAVSADLDRDLLELQATQYENAYWNAVSSDLTLDLGDYASFSKKELQSTSLPEITALVDSIGTVVERTVFQNDQASNDATVTALRQNEIEQSTAQASRKKQLQSWIDVIIEYLTTD